MRSISRRFCMVLPLLLAVGCHNGRPSAPAEDGAARLDAATPPAADRGICGDGLLLLDQDGDTFGEDGSETQVVCEDPNVVPAGYAVQGGDCAPTDTWRNPLGSEICGDWVDDDCDGEDSVCPTTKAVVHVPDWDCQGTPPDNVFAWASVGDGGGRYAPGGCFAFFHSANTFYMSPLGIEPLEEVTCGSWDERLHAFTVVEDAEHCEPIAIDAQFEFEDPPPEQAMQPVSNHCRKFLRHMLSESRFSYVAPDHIRMVYRLQLFPKLEIACAQTRIHEYPWSSVLVLDIERNAGFRPSLDD